MKNKFRAWDRGIKEMISWNKLKFHLLRIEEYRPCIALMQYTNLFDKNNVEICEGDLVKYTEHEGYLLPSFEFEVVKNSKKACFGYYENENLFVPFAEHDELEEDFLKHCEIVGNKFEKLNK